MSEVELTLLCNQPYSLPTIITLSELLNLGIFNRANIVLYPPFKDPLFYEALGKIAAQHKTEIQLTPIKQIPFKEPFKSGHFSTQIFAKLVLPHASSKNISIFIDSGYLICNRERTIQYIKEEIDKFTHSDLPIAAQSSSQETKLPIRTPILLFNKEKYINCKLLERATSHYPIFMIEKFKSGKCIMPEQALLSEILHDEELCRLDFVNAKYADLSIQNWGKLENQGIVDCNCMYDSCDIFKFTGSRKPWTLSILNPDKRIFLKKVLETSNQYGVNLIGPDAIHLYPVKNTYDECLSISLSEAETIKNYHTYNINLCKSDS